LVNSYPRSRIAPLLGGAAVSSSYTSLVDNMNTVTDKENVPLSQGKDQGEVKGKSAVDENKRMQVQYDASSGY
jgi:hypothetical protein